MNYGKEIFIGNRNGNRFVIFPILFSILIHFGVISYFFEAESSQKKNTQKPQIVSVRISPPPVNPPIYRPQSTSENKDKPDVPRKRQQRQRVKPLKTKKIIVTKKKHQIQGKRLFVKQEKKFQLVPDKQKSLLRLTKRESNLEKNPFESFDSIKLPRQFSNTPLERKLKELKSRTQRDLIRQASRSFIARNQSIGVKSPPERIWPERIQLNENKHIVDYGGQAFQKRRGFDILPWAKNILSRIKRFWHLPGQLNPGIEGEVGLAVAFEKNGQVKSVELQKSSKTQVFDQAALNAFQIGSPFTPLPERVTQSPFRSYFLFKYKYPVQKKSHAVTGAEPGSLKQLALPLIRMGLFRTDSFDSSRIPNQLVLGVESRENVLYKLIHNRQTILGGDLRIGMNYLKINAGHLFDQSRRYDYELVLKTKSSQITQPFSIDIQCHYPINSGTVEDDVRYDGFGIAMFLENQLIAYHKKSISVRQLSMQENHVLNRRAEMAGSPNPFDVTGEKKYQRMSTPVFGLLSLALKAVKKKNEAIKLKKTVRLYKKLSPTFLNYTDDGLARPLDVVIQIL